MRVTTSWSPGPIALSRAHQFLPVCSVTGDFLLEDGLAACRFQLFQLRLECLADGADARVANTCPFAATLRPGCVRVESLWTVICVTELYRPGRRWEIERIHCRRTVTPG